MDRIVERHEALAQTVQIIAGMQLKNEEAHQRNEEAHQRNEEAHLRNQALLEKNQVLIAQVLESIDSLARIAHAHEQRISHLEDRQN